MNRTNYSTGIGMSKMKGEAKKAKEIAARLKQIGIDIETISKTTGISSDEINKLQPGTHTIFFLPVQSPIEALHRPIKPEHILPKPKQCHLNSVHSSNF